MELRDFAEQVLFGPGLADKLVRAGALSDEAPGPARRVHEPVHAPGFAPREAGPLPRELDSDRARGELLHRFANHELGALQIMAATLLRFPEAPAAFRMMLGRTMIDEQRHLRLYLDRVVALGVEPGSVPCNDFFWRCAADLESPFDYLLRVPLTLEQANLDFALGWRARFAAMGDAPTAALLDLVHADELRHVAGGLRLFREWKGEGSDWERWVGGLRMPLSPARGRGPEVDVEGRRAAGFDEDWIARIRVWGGSRGREPVLWSMNPSCEDEVARGRPGYRAPAPLRELAADLAPLMLFLAAREDVVLCPRPPSPAWLATVQAAGFALPQLVEAWRGPVSAHQPWGRSPETEGWTPSLREAYDKVAALRWRAALLVGPEMTPGEAEVCSTMAEVEAAAARGWLLKARFSTAGRGRRRGPLDAGGRRWAEGVLASQGAIRAEPWRERVLDFSLHFDLAERMRFVGSVRFDTDARGQFLGTRPGRWWTREPPELQRFLHGKLPALAARMAASLGPELAALGLRGPVGVDAFVHRHEGGLRLDPLVEVNPRWTMGRISLALQARLHPQARARWVFGPRPALRPLEMEAGLLRRGDLATNDPAQATRIWTTLHLD